MTRETLDLLCLVIGLFGGYGVCWLRHYAATLHYKEEARRWRKEFEAIANRYGSRGR